MRRRRSTAVLLVLAALVVLAFGLHRFARLRSVQIFSRPVAHVATDERVVALTFDDGPVDALADSLADLLEARGVRATFFVTGHELARAPAAGRRLVAGGHELGNHSYSHHRMVLLPWAQLRTEIERTDSLIRAAGQRGPIHFRPPYGYKLVGLPYYLWRTGRATVMWDIEPDSYPEVAASPERIVDHVLERVGPGSVILLHPWYPSRRTSLAAIPLLVDSLHARGYRIATIGALLEGADEVTTR